MTASGDFTPVKTCAKCSIEKLACEFYLKKSGKYGLSSRCKACTRVAAAAYNAANQDKISAQRAIYRAENSDKIKAGRIIYRAANPEKLKADGAAYYAANKERCKALQAAYYSANKDWIQVRDSAYRADNAEKIKARDKAYRAANTESVKARKAEYNGANKDKLTAYFAAHYAANPGRVKANTAAWLEANPGIERIHSQNKRARKRANGGKLSKDIVQRLTTLQRGLCACGCGAKLKDTGHHIDHIQPLAKGGSNTDDNCQLLTPKCNMSKGAKCPIEWAQSKGFLL